MSNCWGISPSADKDALIERLQKEMKEAREDRDAYKRDAARALELLGTGLDDQIDDVRQQTIEECARLADSVMMARECGNELVEPGYAIRALNSNGGGKT